MTKKDKKVADTPAATAGEKVKNPKKAPKAPATPGWNLRFSKDADKTKDNIMVARKIESCLRYAAKTGDWGALTPDTERGKKVGAKRHNGTLINNLMRPQGKLDTKVEVTKQ